MPVVGYITIADKKIEEPVWDLSLDFPPHVYFFDGLLHRQRAEPVFVDLLRRPGIDSQPGGPVRQPYFSYRPARVHRLAKSIPRNRFLGSINVYKYGLRAGILGRVM